MQKDGSLELRPGASQNLERWGRGGSGKPSQSIVSKVSQKGSDTLPQMSTDHLTWEGRGYDLHQQKGISGRMGKRASEDVKLMLQEREHFKVKTFCLA